MRRLALPLVSLLLTCATCSKGGRRSDSTPPTLLAAVFVGAGSTPVAGDSLRLFFDEPVALVGGALLTDADLTLAAGGTLGGVSAAPAQVDTRTLAVPLGPGVNLTPGSSTLALSANNDAVVDIAGNRGRDGAAVVLTRGDGDAPVIALFTASGVDPLLNGQGPAGGRLQVPTSGFTLDLAYRDATSAVDAGANDITANVPVTTGGATLAADTNLVPHLTTVTATAAAASYLVPATVVFPTGEVVLTARVRDSSGMTSTANFTLRTTVANDDLRPFETTVNASQVWFLDTTRDLESYTLVPGPGTTFRVDVVTVANGRPDLHDVLALVGLLGSDAAVNSAGIGRLQAAMIGELNACFGGANVTFTFSSPGAFPPTPSVAYGSHGFSQIAIAGAPTQAGVLGLALYDPSNDTQNNDSLSDFQSVRLGVFALTMVANSNGLGGPSTTLFRQTYDPLRGEVGGNPLGGDGQDASRLAGAVVDARTTVIDNAIRRLARCIAIVVAHETGHSMGLVKNGAMPAGLYGGDAINFPGSNSEHIRMPTSVFPSGSVNIMSPTLNFDLAQSSSTSFNSLNLAYLRERALYHR